MTVEACSRVGRFAACAILLMGSRGEAQQLPACTAQQVQEWQALQGARMGADGADADTPAVHGIAKRFFGGRNWYPISDERETVCGRFANSNLFSRFVEPSEYDWNVFIAPAAGYTFSIDTNLMLMEAKVGACPDVPTEPCLDVEVGARKSHFSNAFVRAFLPKETGRSLLIGQGVCVAGPWVQDENHGNHPEIHPAEQIWWRHPATIGPLHLMAVQDGSGRFKDKDDYEFSGAKPPAFRTWTSEPSRARFRVAFEHQDGQPPARYRLDHLGSADVKDDAQFDTGDIAILDGSSPRLELTKDGALRSRVKLETELACRDNTRVLAIVRTTMAAGQPGGGNGGYLLTRVRQLPLAQTVPTPASKPEAPIDRAGQDRPPPQPEVEVRVAPGSLRAADVGGRRTLVADLEMRPLESSGRVTAARVVAPIEQAVSTDAASRRVVARAVPISSGTRIELAMANGTRSVVELPATALVATIGEPTPGGLVPDAAAADSFARASGLWSTADALPGGVRRVTSWQLAAQPEYGVHKEGRIAAEEESATTRELAAVMKSGRADLLQRVFGRAVPTTAAWTAAIATSATDRVLGVESDSRPSPLVERGTIVIRMPPDAGEVTEVRATLSLTDGLGNTATAARTVWTHVLEGSTAEQLRERVLQRMVDLAGIPSADLTRSTGTRTADARYGSIVRTAATRATADNRLTVDECRSLATLSAGIRKVRSTPGLLP